MSKNNLKTRIRAGVYLAKGLRDVGPMARGIGTQGMCSVRPVDLLHGAGFELGRKEIYWQYDRDLSYTHSSANILRRHVYISGIKQKIIMN